MSPRVFGWVAGLGCLLTLLFGSPAHAQTPTLTRAPLTIFVDTAGVSRVGDDVYLTWVFAKASPTALPSSGILVAFDCGRHMVRRIAHVVYQLDPADSTRVMGRIEEDDGPWSTVSIPPLFNLVCEVGRSHGAGDAYTSPAEPAPPPSANRGTAVAS